MCTTPESHCLQCSRSQSFCDEIIEPVADAQILKMEFPLVHLLEFSPGDKFVKRVLCCVNG